MTAKQLEGISDYVMRHLGDKGSDEMLIEKRLCSKLEEALRQVSFAYYGVISDRISSLVRDICRENMAGVFAEAKEELRLARM